MKRYFKSVLAAVSVLCIASAISLSGCGKRGDSSDSAFPSDFKAMGDTARVAFVMKHAAPDSVARFICRAALGEIEGAPIDSLGIATSYAYEKYTGKDMDLFGEAYDEFVASLPLDKKMRMYAMAGVEDPQGLGLTLGLEYMQSIRDKNMKADEVERELKAFKKACGNDSDTYRRFIIGFHTVLKSDRGADMPKEIYDRFIDYDKDF